MEHLGLGTSSSEGENEVVMTAWTGLTVYVVEFKGEEIDCMEIHGTLKYTAGGYERPRKKYDVILLVG